ncbi:MAG: 6,7-dimethyl-8-ribityllumazine synthase [Zetaproteobacteria bacterium]|nr:6,7-dimethyl-8-ribityllumazine synthase [Pseudobdellovibrionaceae bacterium]|tara:strand:- start:59 stop:535 length:477 start_codon:yes stop_codon:yes gene_type:complete
MKRKTIHIIVSLFNETITLSLLESCVGTLQENGYTNDDIKITKVPGAFELPVIAAKYARKNESSCIICIGAVVRGDTPHFDYICQSVSQSLIDLSVETEKPIIFGVLTTNTFAQAKERCSSTVTRESEQGKKLKNMNKGHEFAMTAINMLELTNTVDM